MSNISESANPFYANKKDLDECLLLLGERPLKLIANCLYFDEGEWKESKWFYQKDTDGHIKKNLLINKIDSFQFSVANEQSKQDYHIHNDTLEIYISEYPIKLFYNKSEPINIEKGGFLIVPPNVNHKVELKGFTYVLQINEGKIPINKDKKRA